MVTELIRIQNEKKKCIRRGGPALVIGLTTGAVALALSPLLHDFLAPQIQTPVPEIHNVPIAPFIGILSGVSNVTAIYYGQRLSSLLQAEAKIRRIIST